MKINRIRIDNFGKLSDFELEFSSGFNSFCENNEYGKSTIMSFIYMMFYGKTANERSSDISKSLRKKYRPWSGQPMSGTLEFDTGGVHYSLYKLFAKSAGSDQVQLINLDTGAAIPVGKDEEIGRRYFGLDAAGFEKSVFIGSTGGFGGSDTSDDIAVRLSNLISAGDEEISGSEVLKRLTDAAEAMVSKSKKKGSLVEAKESLEDMVTLRRNNIEESRLLEQKEEQLDNIKKECAQLNSEKKAITSKLEVLEKTSSLGVLKNIKLQFNKVKELEQQYTPQQSIGILEKAEDILTDIGTNDATLKHMRESKDSQDTPISALEYDEYTSSIRKRDECRQTVEFIKNSVLPAEENYQRIQKQQQQLEEDEPVRPKNDLIMFVLAAVALIGLVVAVVIRKYIAVACAGAGTVLFIILGIVRNQLRASAFAVKDKDYNRRRLDVTAERERLKAVYEHQLDILAQKLRTGVVKDVDRACNEQSKEMYEAQEHIDRLLTRQNCSEDEVHQLYKRSIDAIQTQKMMDKAVAEGQSYRQEFMEVMKVDSDYETALARYNELRNNLGEYQECNRSLNAALATVGMDIDTVLNNITAWEQQLDDAGIRQDETLKLKGELADRRNEIDAALLEDQGRMLELSRQLAAATVDMEELNSRISQTQGDIQDMKEYYDILNVAAANMKKAVDEVGSTFGPELNAATAQIFTGITGGKYPAMIVDREYKISVKEEAGAFHEWKYLSNGTIDQAYFALRLAMTRLLTGDGEKLPLLLDDVFIQYDEERRRLAMEYLKEYSRDSQVIYFSCR